MAALPPYLKQLASKSPEKLIRALNLPRLKEYESYWTCTCPVHGGDNNRAFALFKESLNWSCHTHFCHGTGRLADVFDLICKVRKCNFKQAVEFVKAVYGVGEVDQVILDRIEFEEGLKGLTVHRKAADAVCIQPPELIELYAEHGFEYYVDRAFSPDLLKYFQVGFCPPDIDVSDDLLDYAYMKNAEGKYYPLPYFHNRCVIPIHTPKGELVGFTGRSVDGAEPKFLHTANMPKAGLLYNWHRAIKFLDTSNELVVVESPGVAWSWYRAGFPNVVATLGAHLTHEQARLIQRHNAVNKVIIAYDPDEAGRTGTKEALRLLRGKVNTYSVEIADDMDYDSMSANEIKTQFNKRKVATHEKL